MRSVLYQTCIEAPYHIISTVSDGRPSNSRFFLISSGLLRRFLHSKLFYLLFLPNLDNSLIILFIYWWSLWLTTQSSKAFCWLSHLPSHHNLNHLPVLAYSIRLFCTKAVQKILEEFPIISYPRSEMDISRIEENLNFLIPRSFAHFFLQNFTIFGCRRDGDRIDTCLSSRSTKHRYPEKGEKPPRPTRVGPTAPEWDRFSPMTVVVTCL